MASLGDQEESTRSVAVVGGGISGLFCASTLSQFGYNVSLFDMGKSAAGEMRRCGRPERALGAPHLLQYCACRRHQTPSPACTSGPDIPAPRFHTHRPGGRMTTRRTSWKGLHFDHGCQFIRATSPEFRAVVEGWVAAGAWPVLLRTYMT
jgi:predicted NAD/FAD-dependent oxidoreductase